MNENAEKLLDALPTDGSKVSGGTILDQLDLSKSEYKKAKAELSEAGMVTLGRGRGGTIARIVGAEAPPEPKKLTKAEQMAIAREEKQARSREQKIRDGIRGACLEQVEKDYPDADEIQIQVWDVNIGKCFATVWTKGEGGIVREYFIGS